MASCWAVYRAGVRAGFPVGSGRTAWAHFDPVEIYGQLSQYMASGATGPAFTPTPQTQTDEVGGGEQLLPQPFGGYRIPSKYLFENPNDCPEEVVGSVRPLIREWAQARGGISYSWTI